MPDTAANNELLSKILERLDQLDQKFTGEIRSVQEGVQSVRGEVQSVRGEVQSVRGEVQSVRERVDQLDEKFTGEIQAARKEAQEFHNASQESFGHLQRVVENEARKRVAFEQKMDQRWDEQQRIWLEIWDGIRRTMEKDDQRILNDEKILARLEKEIEALKKDKDTIIAEFAEDRSDKDAIIRDLQQRISRLETTQNIAD
jgi:chromosome segregation ATPase